MSWPTRARPSKAQYRTESTRNCENETGQPSCQNGPASSRCSGVGSGRIEACDAANASTTNGTAARRTTALRILAQRVVARVRRAVLVPAFCDTPPGSVRQRFRLATICAAPDVICGRERTLCHSLLSHRTHPIRAPRQVARSERNQAGQTSKRDENQVWRDPPGPESPANAYTLC